MIFQLINVIGTDCGRIYDAVVLGQMAIGGPIVLLLSAGYIVWELGWLALLGMAVFPLAYPLQVSDFSELNKLIH